MKIALLQLKTLPTPEENLEKIKQMLTQAKEMGADLAVLPEMCCCPYENSAFVRYAMPENAPFLQGIAESAKTLGLYVVAGSVPLAANGKIYNASFVYDTEGKRIAAHRKTHLFDINVPGGQYFMESDTFTAGRDVTTFDTPWGKLGLMICYDIRFPELSRLLALEGAKAILVPAAFNMTTGPAHWEMSFRMRALDNQVFLAGCAPARDLQSSYTAWGHSIVTDPWGKLGLMICYDIRFPELSRLLALEGAKAILVPAAFNMTTGPAHWEMSFRMRALDNQVFLAGCAPARDLQSSYTAWGHSIVTDPWGSVVAELDETEGILTAELDFARLAGVREQLPLLKHRRTDFYDIIRK